jgi:teichuronic acid biosynthesis glycosyltransferase TuaC
MNASDALLLTSLHEGSPNVVKEALAVNLPVVSTNVGDVPDRIRGIPGSTLLECDDPVSIAAALQKTLINNQRSRQPLHRNGIRREVPVTESD